MLYILSDIPTQFSEYQNISPRLLYPEMASKILDALLACLTVSTEPTQHETVLCRFTQFLTL